MTAWLYELEEAHMGQFIRVASTADLHNTCTHRGGPLCEGGVSGEEVTCPWHGAVYNLKTGAVLSGPAPRGVASYAVRVQGSAIEVEL
jgi:nitrite reductase/ring-hydroxylating ferredoxin subunit